MEKGNILFEVASLLLLEKSKSSIQAYSNLAALLDKHTSFLLNMDFQLPQTFSGTNFICAREFFNGDLVFKCFDCGNNTLNHVYCQECFILEKHIGHRVEFRNGRKGCCDCGDCSLLKNESFCDKHKGFDKESLMSQIKSIPIELDSFFVILSEFFLHTAWEHIELVELERNTDEKELEFKHYILENYFDFVRELLQKYSWFGVYFTDRILSQELKYFKTLYHNCKEKKQFYYLKEENPCTCKIIDLVFRYGIHYTEEVNKSMFQLFLQLYSNQEFKILSTRTFLNNIELIFHCKEIIFKDDFLPKRLLVKESQMFRVINNYSSNESEIIWESPELISIFDILRSLWKIFPIEKTQTSAINIFSEIIDFFIHIRENKNLLRNQLNKNYDLVNQFFEALLSFKIPTQNYTKYQPLNFPAIFCFLKHVYIEFQNWISVLPQEMYQCTLEKMIYQSISPIRNWLDEIKISQNDELYFYYNNPLLPLSLVISNYSCKDVLEKSKKILEIISKALNSIGACEEFWTDVFTVLNHEYEKQAGVVTSSPHALKAISCFKDFKILNLAFLFLYQYSASCLPCKFYFPLEKFTINELSNPMEIKCFLAKLILLTKDFTPILLISNISETEYENSLFSEYLEIFLRTLLIAFERKNYGSFIKYLRKTEIEPNLIQYANSLPKYLNLDSKTKLIKNKVEEIKYDPCIFYTANSKIKTCFFEVIESFKKPDIDPVIGNLISSSKWDHLYKNTVRIINNPSIVNKVMEGLEYFSSKCTNNNLNSNDTDSLYLMLIILNLFLEETGKEHAVDKLFINENVLKCLEAYKNAEILKEFHSTITKLIKKFQEITQYKKTIDFKSESADQERMNAKKILAQKQQEDIKKIFLQKQNNFFKNFAKEFSEIKVNENLDEEKEQICVICKSSDNNFKNPLCFITTLQNDNLSKYYSDEENVKNTETSQNHYELVITGCDHIIHRDCCEIKSVYFHCPACRGFSNNIVPIISKNSKKLILPKLENITSLKINKFDDKLDFIKPSEHLEEGVFNLAADFCLQLQIRFLKTEMGAHNINTLAIDLLLFPSEQLLTKDIFHAEKNLNLMRELYLLARANLISDREQDKILNSFQKDAQTFLACRFSDYMISFQSKTFEFLKLFWKLSIAVEFKGETDIESMLFMVILNYLKYTLIIRGLSLLPQRYPSQEKFEFSFLSSQILNDDAFKYSVLGCLEPYINLLMGLLSVIYDIDMKTFLALDDIYEKFENLQNILGIDSRLENILETSAKYDEIKILDCILAGSAKKIVKINPKAFFYPTHTGTNYYEFITENFFKRCHYCKSYPSAPNSSLHVCFICGQCFCDIPCNTEILKFKNKSSLEDHVLRAHESYSVFLNIFDGEITYIYSLSDVFSSKKTLFKVSEGYLYLNTKGQEKLFEDTDFASYLRESSTYEQLVQDIYERRICERVFYKK